MAIRAATTFAMFVACDKGVVEPPGASVSPPAAVLDAAVEEAAPPDAHGDYVICSGGPVHRDIYVRACNDTGRDLSSLRWSHGWPGGGLARQACTSYRAEEYATARAGAVFMIGDAQFKVIPAATLEESESLKPGRWSFHIRVVDFAKRVADIRVRRDRD